MLKTALRAAVISATLLAAVPAMAADDPVVAKVNGKNVLQSEVLALRDEMAAQMPQIMSIPVERILPELTERAVDRRLLTDAAKQAGMEKDADVKKQLDMIRTELMQRAFLSREVEKQVTDEALRKMYDEQITSFVPEEEVHARHILLKTEEDAKAVIVKLKAGEDFEALAKSASVGPTGPRGGDLGYFTKDAMLPAFSEAAFALEKGAYSQAPVQTEYGWHVIKVEDRRKTAAPTFEEVKDQLRSQMAQAAMVDIVDGLRKKAKVEILVKPAEEAPAETGK
jgi:peptidyl-prolyl cis-trans isomerase C